MHSSMRTTLASIAVSSVVMLGSARANAFDHVDAAYHFVYNAVVNDANISSGCYINWDTMQGHTRGACFFVSAFAFANGYSGSDLFNMWGGSGPGSEDLYQLIHGSPNYVATGDVPPVPETYFRKVPAITSVQSGDILAIGQGSDGYAGHTMIVRGSAVLMTQTNPKWAGTLQWAVPIIDATASVHSKCPPYTDSRWIQTGSNCNTGIFDDGAGFAWLRVYTDLLTGKMIGYTWSNTNTSTAYYYSRSVRPFDFGRLVNLPEPEGPEDPPPPPP